MLAAPAIHVHVPADKRTAGYARYAWETMRMLANRPDDLRLTIHSIGPTAAERLKDMDNARCMETKSLRADKELDGSWGHACCAMQAMSMACDGDLHIICDSDTVMLARGWDDYVRMRIVVAGVGIVGTTYEDIGGFSSADSSTQTYKKIPALTWMALHPKHDWRTLQLLPDKAHRITISNESQARVYNLPIGFSTFGEVGWQVPQFLADNGISYEGWTHHKPSKDALVLKRVSDYNEEFHVSDIPIVAHQRGSLRHAFREEKMSKDFYAAMDAWRGAERAREPRWTWDVGTPEAQQSLELLALESSHKPAASAYDLLLHGSERGSDRTLPSNVAVQPTLTVNAGFARAADKETLAGWLKATLDGANVWSRHVPAPKVLNLSFDRSDSCRHLRLEGLVSDARVSLPGTSDRPYTLAIRNATGGAVTCEATSGDLQVSIPQGKCWLLVVDVDGVVHAE